MRGPEKQCLCSGLQPLASKWRSVPRSASNSAPDNEVWSNFLNERDGLFYSSKSLGTFCDFKLRAWKVQCVQYTVWKLHNFTITQILREIKMNEYRISKILHCNQFRGYSFWISWNFSLFAGWNFPNWQNSELLEWQIAAFLNF